MEREFDINLWEPRTSIGRAVKGGEIRSLAEILRKGRRISEPEIVDALEPDLREDILSVNMVRRMHKSGRRAKYHVIAVVGNGDGIVGVGHASASEIGSSIRKAAAAAKLNVIEVVRGCGSWECKCGEPHSLPFAVMGRSGNTRVTVMPAPKGLGIAAAKVPRTILQMAGIRDAWTKSRGPTRATINFAFAAFDALKQTSRIALREPLEDKVFVGKIGGAGA